MQPSADRIRICDGGAARETVRPLRRGQSRLRDGCTFRRNTASVAVPDDAHRSRPATTALHLSSNECDVRAEVVAFENRHDAVLFGIVTVDDLDIADIL